LEEEDSNIVCITTVSFNYICYPECDRMKKLALAATLSFLFLFSAFLNAFQFEKSSLNYSFGIEKIKTRLYDFGINASLDKWACRYDAANMPPSPGVPSIEFNALEYWNISRYDNVYQIDVGGNIRHAAHRFVFTIYENKSNITNLNIFWRGLGVYLLWWNGQYYIIPSGSGIVIYAWNYTSSIYDEILNTTSYNTVNLSTNISLDYISSSGELTLLAEQRSTTFLFGWLRFYSVIATDYVSVEVEYV